MDFVRRFQRTAKPESTWETSRLRDWIHTLNAAAPNLWANQSDAKAAFLQSPRDAQLMSKLRDAYAAIRDWSAE
jgi:hypothetical protein